MKAFFALVCALVFAFLGAHYASYHFDEAKRFAGKEPAQITNGLLAEERNRFNTEQANHRQSMKEWEKNPQLSEPSPPRPVRWQSADDPELLKVAQAVIARSDEVARMSVFKVVLWHGLSTVAGFLFGGGFYLFWCFVITITTKPLEAEFDSMWGNFKRFVLGPFILVAVTGVFAWILFAEMLMKWFVPLPQI